MIHDIDSFVTPFVMYCDEHNLSLTEGIGLAETIGESMEFAADDRRDYLPVELVDDEDSFQESKPS